MTTPSTSVPSVSHLEPSSAGRLVSQWRRIPAHGRLLVKVAATLTVLVAGLSAASAAISTDVEDFPGIVSAAEVS
jgi:hypothetical protein